MPSRQSRGPRSRPAPRAAVTGARLAARDAAVLEQASIPRGRRRRHASQGDPQDPGFFQGVILIRILIAEDEERISRFIEKGLRAAGYAPTVVADGVTAVDYASSGEFDLLLLDIGIPRLDGFAVLAALRHGQVQLPVIILTARSSSTDTVAALEGGADDYIVKPFHFEELVARIRARTRKGDTGDVLAGSVLRYGPLELNLLSRTVSVEGRLVELSTREFALVEMFLLHPGQVLSRQQLLSHVWGYDFDGTSNVVDVYVRQLRMKIGADRILTTRGAGYRLG